MPYIVWLLTGVLWLGGTGPTYAADEGTVAGTLSLLTVSADDHAVVVTLGADRTLGGTLESTPGEPRQLRLSLPGIAPSVDAVTQVAHAVVQRVRVEFNWSVPPVTTVLLDLRDEARYTLETDAGGVLRIIVREPQSDYTDWLAAVVVKIERLLEIESGRRAGHVAGSSDLDRVSQWQAMQAEVEAATQPRELREPHRALWTATQLGLQAASEDVTGERQPARPSAALAGAHLSLRIAQALGTQRHLDRPTTQ